MQPSFPPPAAAAASSKEAATTVAPIAALTPHHEDGAPATFHESTLQQLTHDPLLHAAHPSGPCLSLDCLRAHCQWLASVDPAAAAAAGGQASSTASSPSTSPFSGSPRSTRSGTSPGYANDWALRPEPLAVRSDKPTRTRSDRAVHRLASAKLAESTGAAAATAQMQLANVAICATTDDAVATSSSSFASCSLAAATAACSSSATAASSPSAFVSQQLSAVGMVAPAAISSSELRLDPSSSSSVAPIAAPIPAGDTLLQPTVGALSKLLQRRQQRKQQDGHAT